MDDERFAPLDGAHVEMPHATPAADATKAVADPVVLPAAAPLPGIVRHGSKGVPARMWEYRDASGALLFLACRFDKPDGGKDVQPYSCTAAGKWVWQAPQQPRPLYGLPELAARPDAPVVVVEGEKAADAARVLFPDHVAVTWPGGTNAVALADWRPLAGRQVAVWPDNDDAGRKAAVAVVKAATSAGVASVAVVAVPVAWPPKWDVADALPDGVAAETLAEMLAAARAPEPDTSPGSAPGDALRAAVEEAAAMQQADYLATRRATAARLVVPVGQLDALRAQAIKEKREAAQARAAADMPDDAGEPQPDARGRTRLLVNGADLPDTATELAEMLAAQPHLFDRGGPAGVARDATTGGFVVTPLTVEGVVSEAHRVARPWRWRPMKDGGMEPEDVTLPDRVARLYLDNRAGWGLRALDGITSAPLLHDDGSMRVAEGYDAETRLWCEAVPDVALPEHPTRADAEAALLRLRHHFRSFAFGDAERIEEAGFPVPVVNLAKPPGADESAAIVGLLTAVCRPCLWTAPALMVKAPEYSGAGTGKGLLVGAICAIAYGIKPPAITAGGGQEETEKRLAACLMAAGQVLFLDNLNGVALKSEILASAITERPARVRILGRSELVPLNPTCFVAVTGNGLRTSEDLARRFIIVTLDAGMEDPETRPFPGDLRAETLAARSELLQAALTIWRWGRLQGDALKKGKPLGSFPQWARWCRDPLLALGCQDPVARVADAKAQDPRRQRVAETFAAWWKAHGSAPIALADLSEDVLSVIDPANRGRQFVQAVVAPLDGTRAAGFVMRRSASVGKWSADKYVLQQVQDAPATDEAAEPAAKPFGADDAPYAPYAPYGSGGRSPEPEVAGWGWEDKL